MSDIKVPQNLMKWAKHGLKKVKKQQMEEEPNDSAFVEEVIEIVAPDDVHERAAPAIVISPPTEEDMLGDDDVFTAETLSIPIPIPLISLRMDDSGPKSPLFGSPGKEFFGGKKSPTLRRKFVEPTTEVLTPSFIERELAAFESTTSPNDPAFVRRASERWRRAHSELQNSCNSPPRDRNMTHSTSFLWPSTPSQQSAFKRNVSSEAIYFEPALFDRFEIFPKSSPQNMSSRKEKKSLPSVTVKSKSPLPRRKLESLSSKSHEFERLLHVPSQGSSLLRALSVPAGLESSGLTSSGNEPWLAPTSIPTTPKPHVRILRSLELKSPSLPRRKKKTPSSGGIAAQLYSSGKSVISVAALPTPGIILDDSYVCDYRRKFLREALLLDNCDPHSLPSVTSMDSDFKGTLTNEPETVTVKSCNVDRMLQVPHHETSLQRTLSVPVGLETSGSSPSVNESLMKPSPATPKPQGGIFRSISEMKSPSLPRRQKKAPSGGGIAALLYSSGKGAISVAALPSPGVILDDSFVCDYRRQFLREALTLDTFGPNSLSPGLDSRFRRSLRNVSMDNFSGNHDQNKNVRKESSFEALPFEDIFSSQPILSEKSAIMFPSEPRPEWHKNVKQTLHKATQKIRGKPGDEPHDTNIPEHLRYQLKQIYVY